MRASSIFRAVFAFLALSVGAVLRRGVRSGPGRGLRRRWRRRDFRPKNPEIKKRTVRTTPVPGAVPHPERRNARRNEDNIEDLLEKGNQFRDARRFAEAETSYQRIFKIKPKDGRAAYGLGNIYSDQQRWEEAEAAYRNAVLWSPTDVDALVALSVVLVQPRTGAGNAETFCRRRKLCAASGISCSQRTRSPGIGWASRCSRAVYSTMKPEHAYRRAVELDPEFPVAYAHLARVLNRMGQADEAAPLYDKATQLAKDPATLESDC